jgi:hypothetical protein
LGASVQLSAGREIALTHPQPGLPDGWAAAFSSGDCGSGAKTSPRQYKMFTVCAVRNQRKSMLHCTTVRYCRFRNVFLLDRTRMAWLRTSFVRHTQ